MRFFFFVEVKSNKGDNSPSYCLLFYLHLFSGIQLELLQYTFFDASEIDTQLNPAIKSLQNNYKPVQNILRHYLLDIVSSEKKYLK